jgi:TRAP-type C4-dicarboxylate transport system permease small subunit
MAKSFLETFEVKTEIISKYMASLAGLSAFAMMIVVITDVALVALNIGSLSIAVSLVEMLMIISIFGAMAYADVLDRHVVANIVVDRLPYGLRVISGIFSNMVSLGICFFISWQLLIYAWEMTSIRKTCLSSDFPYYPFTWVAVLGFLLLDLRYVIRVIRNFGRLSTRRMYGT